MANFVKYSSNLKVIVLAGAMALTTLSAVAQQEVDPDHFDGNQTAMTAPKNGVSKAHKAATAQKVNAASKPTVRQAKTSKNSARPRVVTVAAH